MVQNKHCKNRHEQWAHPHMRTRQDGGVISTQVSKGRTVRYISLGKPANSQNVTKIVQIPDESTMKLDQNWKSRRNIRIKYAEHSYGHREGKAP